MIQHSEKWKYDGIYGPGGLPGYGHSNHGAKALGWLLERHAGVIDVGCGHNEFVKAWRVKKGEMENGSDGVLGQTTPPSLHSSITPFLHPSIGCDFACPGADVIAPATKLPFEDEAFSLVTAFDVLEHLPEAEVMPALREMARVSRWYCFSIATRPSTILWQGHNLHPTVRPLDWWLDRIREAGGVPEPGPPGYVYGRWSGGRRAEGVEPRVSNHEHVVLQSYFPGLEPASVPPVVEKPAPAARPPKKGAVPRRDMTADENLIVTCLKRQVTTPPACWDKRFIRDVGSGGQITEKEAAQAWRLFHKYRRQISSPAKERLLEMAKHLAAPDLRKKP